MSLSHLSSCNILTTMAAPVLPITELAQLAQVKDDFFPASFVTNAKCIFDHDHNDIKKILNDKDLVTLKNIRNALLTGVEQLFPSFPAKLGLPRMNSDKSIFIQDILLLGASIAKQSPTEHLYRIYVSTQEQQDALDISGLDLSDGSVMITVVTGLLQTVESIKRKLNEQINDNELQRNNNELLRNENIVLTNRVAILESRLELEGQIKPIADTETAQTNKTTPSLVVIDPVAANNLDTPTVEARPVKAAVKTAYAFVGNIEGSCTANDIQKTIAKKTTINLKISDIQLLNTRGDNVAFKIRVPKDKLQVLTSKSIWGEGIKAEVFDPQRPKQFHTPKGARPNSGYRNFNRSKPFRDHYSYRHGSYNRSPFSSDRYYRDSYQTPFGY